MVIFWIATVGVMTALVKVQVICAAGKTLAAGMVINRPLNVPKLAGLPVTAELASVQVAVVKVKAELLPSEIWTTLFKLVTALATGTAGAAVAAAIVVIEAGAAARLLTAKVNGPPKLPVVIFCTATLAAFAALVNVQVILAAGKTLAAGMVRTRPLNVPKLGGFPVIAILASAQVAVVIV